jgi:hypothetical protein
MPVYLAANESAALHSQNQQRARPPSEGKGSSAVRDQALLMFQSILMGVPLLEMCDNDDCGKTITIPFACCSRTNQIVAVDSNLSPLLRYNNSWEFTFQITVLSPDGDDLPFITQDREMAYNYIPTDIRPIVMHLVCASFLKLLAHITPQRVYRVTSSRNPPEKALRKHHLLSGVLEEMRYAITQRGTDPLGRVFWVFERVGD